MLVTLFNPNKNLIQKGTCCFINEEESFFLHDDMKGLLNECNSVLLNKSSLVQNYEGSCTVLFQFIPPATKLVIVGAGNDAQPLCNMALLLGWEIVVVDGRPSYATQQRFPSAKVIVSKPTEMLSNISIDKQTAVILMTHNYNYDLAALQQLINTNCKYIGVLGPKKKLYKMFDELSDKGILIDEEMMQNIYGPVGLDIGAETSEEIAASIIAEIKAVFSKRYGASLKERSTEIHERIF